jgi:hypothetical protein
MGQRMLDGGGSITRVPSQSSFLPDLLASVPSK